MPRYKWMIYTIEVFWKKLCLICECKGWNKWLLSALISRSGCRLYVNPNILFNIMILKCFELTENVNERKQYYAIRAERINIMTHKMITGFDLFIAWKYIPLHDDKVSTVPVGILSRNWLVWRGMTLTHTVTSVTLLSAACMAYA